MNSKFIFPYFILVLLIGFGLGLIFAPTHSSIEELAKSNLAGLQEGFDKGFISGQDYQQGVHIRMTNQTLEKEFEPENANWYLRAGYLNKKDMSEYNDSVLNFNPYTMVIHCRNAYPSFQIDTLKNVNPYTVLKSCEELT